MVTPSPSSAPIAPPPPPKWLTGCDGNLWQQSRGWCILGEGGVEGACLVHGPFDWWREVPNCSLRELLHTIWRILTPINGWKKGNADGGVKHGPVAFWETQWAARPFQFTCCGKCPWKSFATPSSHLLERSEYGKKKNTRRETQDYLSV